MCDENNEQPSFFQASENGKYNLAFPNSAASKVFNTTTTDLSQLKDAVEIFWSYPTNTLTLIIETGYTAEQQDYSIALDAESMGDNVTRVDRIIDGNETEVKPENGKYMLESDSKGQVAIKLHSWPTMTTYGVYIRYQIIQK